MTLFCKDRLDDTDDPNGVAVYWHIRSSRKMFIEITAEVVTLFIYKLNTTKSFKFKNR